MKLRARKYLPAIVAAVASAAAVGCSGASASPVTHTYSFTAWQQQMATFSTTHSGAQEKDVNKAGKIIGYDLLNYSFNPTTKAFTVGVTVLANGGFIYCNMQTSGKVFHGTVTGGTGTFAGATGTISATSPSASSPETFVTITYHT